MLQIENASIAYGNDILFSGFNLQLERGEIASISGPSGCGKSSLLNAILGFTPLKEGRIVLNGILLDKGNVDVVRKQTAWIPQELALPLEWVKDMVQLPFGLKANRGTPFSETRLFACFEDLGLEQELYYKRVNEISGGQRQRMMIAVASMIGKPLTIGNQRYIIPQPGHRIIAIINTAVLHLEVQDRTVARYCDRYGTHDCPVVLHRHILELPLLMG